MLEIPIKTILHHAKQGANLRETFFQSQAPLIANIALRLAFCIAKGNKILFCGNGGSAADCQHFAAEFVNRFILDRPPLPAIALTTDTSTITAIANDFGYEQVFAKQILALGNSGDILIAISTSGNSLSILHALAACQDKGITSIGLTGNGGGKMTPLCDFVINVPDKRTPLIQEIHIAVGHLLCQLTDYFLFENVAALSPYLEGVKALPAPSKD